MMMKYFRRPSHIQLKQIFERLIEEANLTNIEVANIGSGTRKLIGGTLVPFQANLNLRTRGFTMSRVPGVALRRIPRLAR